MTTTSAPETEPDRGDTAQKRPDFKVPYSPRISLTAAIPAMDEADRYRYWGSVLVALGMVLVVFVLQVALVLPVKHMRDQQTAFHDFRYELANGTAPVGQIGADDVELQQGMAVALITIPSIGLDNEVILNGTNSAVTASGPGLRRDTVLPGQAGASVILGRSSAYGAPFRALGQMKVGDTITATTGQGVSTYRVTNVRRDGDPLPEAMPATAGRLTLVSTIAAIPYFSGSIIRVDATLESDAFVTPRSVVATATLGAAEQPLAGDISALPWLILLLIAVLVMTVLVVYGVRYWGRWQSWLIGFPIIFLLGSLASTQAMTLLPNTL